MNQHIFWILAFYLIGCNEHPLNAIYDCISDEDCPLSSICSADRICIEDTTGAEWLDLTEITTINLCGRDIDCDSTSICLEGHCEKGERCQDGTIRSEIELCDGDDNDCDGEIDEDFSLGAECTVGIGECKRSGTITCTMLGLGTQCSVIPGFPSLEQCDHLDNDCDGVEDENFDLRDSPCEVGIGGCKRSGYWDCSSDGLELECKASPGLPTNELCGNGTDDNCDGEVDEGYFDLGQSCVSGLGECAQNGALVCSFDGLSTVCDAIVGVPSNEVCDGLDNDCNGQIDGFLEECSSPCNTGFRFCIDGSWTACSAKNPDFSDVCGDQIDNDCDGEIDNGCQDAIILVGH